MRKGYLTSSCDCMECTALWGHGPFVVRRETLADYLSSLPKEAMGNSRTMFLEWSLRATRIQGLKIRMCPDIMYLTGKSPPGKLAAEQTLFSQSLLHTLSRGLFRAIPFFQNPPGKIGSGWPRASASRACPGPYRDRRCLPDSIATKSAWSATFTGAQGGTSWSRGAAPSGLSTSCRPSTKYRWTSASTTN